MLRIGDPGFRHVVNRLSAVLAQSAAAIEKGAVISVEETRHRIRYLPIGAATGGE